MALNVKLDKHQSDASRLMGSAVQHGWPIVILEVDSKLVPGETVKVLAVSLIDLDTKQQILVPLARLFEDHPMDVCYAPKIHDQQPTRVVDVLSDVYGTLKGWELQIVPKQ